MNKKVIFILIVMCMAIASISSASAWWIFGEDTYVTVNGIDFNIPEGFKYYELAGNSKTETQYGLNSENGEQSFIHIKVSNLTSSANAENLHLGKINSQ